MGYYSEIGIAMVKEDFEDLMKICEEKQSNKEYNKYNSLLLEIESCDHYYLSTWQNRVFNKEKKVCQNIGPTKTIVVLHYNFTKTSRGFDYLYDYISGEAKYGGCYARVGEETGDVEYEQFNNDEDIYIEWYEYVEPVSYVQILEDTKELNETGNFGQFIENLEKCS